MGKFGSLTTDEILHVTYLQTFVETGTYHGDSTRAGAAVYTIEIVNELYERNINTPGSGVNYYLGDSLLILPKIISQISSPTFWFLDAHQSGPDTSNNGKWVPLMEELQIIMGGTDSGLIVIDDLRLFDQYWDWVNISVENINKIIETSGHRITNKYEYNDRYIISYSNSISYKK
jgi:hypothetical protein